MKLRKQQIEKAQELTEVIDKLGMAYLMGQPRSGKSLTALQTAGNLNHQNVLFVTKKKAISSVQEDYKNFGFSYNLEVINYASIHKVENKKPDFVIYDEAHCMGAFAKPSQRTKKIRHMFYEIPCILMTGTMAVESMSQVYHQFHVSIHSPFNEFKNFYRWADVYVNKKQQYFTKFPSWDYSDAKTDKIMKAIEPYIVRMTRKASGVTTEVNEIDLHIDTPNKIDSLAKMLIEKRTIIGKSGIIETDGAAALANKVHQIYNGSVIIEGNEGGRATVVLDHFKAEFIKQKFAKKKIAIFYYFKAEYDMIRNVYGDEVTDDLEEFNSTEKSIAVQFRTSEGMNLSKAECIVFLNVGFSGKDYLQARQRLNVAGRKTNDVYFIIEKGGITKKVLRAVRAKKDFNSRLFKKEFL